MEYQTKLGEEFLAKTSDDKKQLNISSNGTYIKGVGGYDGINIGSEDKSVQEMLDDSDFTENDYNWIFGTPGVSTIKYIFIDNFDPNNTNFNEQDWLEEIESVCHGHVQLGSLQDLAQYIYGVYDSGNDPVNEAFIGHLNRYQWDGISTIEYNGETYQLWELYTSSGSDWYLGGMYGLFDPELTYDDIQSESIYTNDQNRFHPFDAILNDDDIYDNFDHNDKVLLVAIPNN